jgi:hypothetical protein
MDIRCLPNTLQIFSGCFTIKSRLASEDSRFYQASMPSTAHCLNLKTGNSIGMLKTVRGMLHWDAGLTLSQ